MRWRRILLLVAVSGIAAGIALEFSARRTATALARSLEPLASLTYSSAGVSFDGSVRLRDPRLDFHVGDWKGQLQARVADVRGSTALWLVGQWLSGDADFPDQMSIRTTALRFGEGGSSSALAGWLGTSSLVPFENLGCGSDPLSDKDRISMGIEALERIDRFDYRLGPASKKVHFSMDLRDPNVSVIRGFAEFSGLDAAHWQELSEQPLLRLDRAGITYEDAGYFVRRNQFCAQWLGSSSVEFIDRHMTAVHEFLDARGIRPSKDLFGLYKNLVTRGGTLGLSSLPDASWAPSEFAAYPRKNLLRQLNVTSRLGDAPPIMFRLAFADPDKPLGVDPSEIPVRTVFADASELVESSEIGPGVDGSSVPEAVDEPVAAPTPVQVDSTAPVAVVDPPQQAPAGLASPPDLAEVADPVPPLSDRRVVASAPPPPKDSILALVWKPGVIERLPPRVEKKKSYRVVPLAGLNALTGEDVRFITSNGKRVSGELLKVTADHAVLKIRVGRGEAELNVSLKQIREIRVPLIRN